MAGRQTRGRQRIPIRRIQNQDDLYATFSKRRQGLYKKASELATLCGVDIGVIIFSPTDNPYSFFHPTMQSVIDRYRDPNQPQNTYARAMEHATRSRIEELNRRLDEILEEKEQLIQRNKYLDEIDTTRQKGWWEQTPIETLNKEQVKEWTEWFQGFKDQLQTRIQVVGNGGSSSQNVAGPGTGVGSSSFAAPDHDVPLQDHHDPSSAGGSGYMPAQYFYDPPSQNPETGGESDHFGGQFLFTGQSENPSSSGGGGSGHIPGGIFYPPLFQDGGGSGRFPGQGSAHPSSSGGGGSTQLVPPGAQDHPSTAGGNREAGSSDKEHVGN